MEHDRETINGKLRAYNAGKGSLQEFVSEIEAFFEELEELEQKMQLDLPKIPLEEKELPCYIKGSLAIINKIFGRKPTMTQISVFCPLTKRNVVFEVAIETFTDPTMQIATPYICFHLRTNGCIYSLEPDCLRLQRLQGNFSADIIRSVLPAQPTRKVVA